MYANKVNALALLCAVATILSRSAVLRDLEGCNDVLASGGRPGFVFLCSGA